MQFCAPQCSSSQSMAYPPSGSGSLLAAERLRRRLRPMRWRCHRAASRTSSPTITPTVTTQITTTANRRHGRWPMRVLQPSLLVPLPFLSCFLHRRTYNIWYDPHELSKSRVLFHPNLALFIIPFLLGFLRCGRFLLDKSNTVPHLERRHVATASRPHT